MRLYQLVVLVVSLCCAACSEDNNTSEVTDDDHYTGECGRNMVPLAVSPCSAQEANDASEPCSNETRLLHALIDRYNRHDKTLRPVWDPSHKVTVYYGMRLINMEVDEKTQTLTTSVWIRMRWCDELMTWNNTEFGVRSLILPLNQIWRPDTITVVNTIDTSTHEREVSLNVRHDGRVLWFPQRQYKSECLLDLKEYPFDVHTCTLWVQSLSLLSSQVDLQPYYFNRNTPWDLDTYLISQRLSQEWEIISNTSMRQEVPRDEAAILMYSRRVALKFTLTIRRRPGFISYLLRFPVVILSFMCVLVFCLPTERPDRHMLAMSVFACFMILLLILVENVPPSAASMPKLVYLYCVYLASAVACISCSVFCIHVSRRGETGHVPPKWVHRVIFDVCGRLLCIHRGRFHEAGYTCTPPPPTHEHTPCIDASGKSDNTQGARSLMAESNHNKMAADKQWRLVAFILDRLFCILFLIIDVIVLVIYFPT